MATLKTIENDLNLLWNPAAAIPASAVTAQAFDSLRNDIKDQYSAVASSLPLAVKAEELLLDLNTAIAAIEKHRTLLTDAMVMSPELLKGGDLYDRDLQILAYQIRERRTSVQGMLDNLNQNARTQFSDQGAWAMHFSVVRMTITTFLIGISWGVISLKWDEYSPQLRVAAIGVWTMAGIFLCMFTYMTYGASKKQKRLKNLIPTREPLKSEPSTESVIICLRDLFSFWFIIKRLLGIRSINSESDHQEEMKKGMHEYTAFFIWLPFSLFIWLSFGFGWVCWKWHHHDSEKKINWTVLIEPQSKVFSFTNKIDHSNTIFTAAEHLSFTNWIEKIQDYARAFATNRHPTVDVEIPFLTTNFNSVSNELKQIADAVARLPKQPLTMPSTVALDTTRIDCELSNVVNAISNLARAMPTNLLVTNNVNLEMRNTGFLLHLGRNEVKVK